jgi:hypothetical protein
MKGRKSGSEENLGSLKNANITDQLVNETLNLLEEGRQRIFFHPKKEYVLIVGKAGTGNVPPYKSTPHCSSQVIEKLNDLIIGFSGSEMYLKFI